MCICDIRPIKKKMAGAHQRLFCYRFPLAFVLYHFRASLNGRLLISSFFILPSMKCDTSGMRIDWICLKGRCIMPPFLSRRKQLHTCSFWAPLKSSTVELIVWEDSVSCSLWLVCNMFSSWAGCQIDKHKLT